MRKPVTRGEIDVRSTGSRIRDRDFEVLERVLGSRTRHRVLVALLRPRARPWLRELCRDVGTGAGSVLRELDRLQSVGLVVREREAGACFVRANERHPLYEPLRNLVEAALAYERGETPLAHVRGETAQAHERGETALAHERGETPQAHGGAAATVPGDRASP